MFARMYEAFSIASARNSDTSPSRSSSFSSSSVSPPLAIAFSNFFASPVKFRNDAAFCSPFLMSSLRNTRQDAAGKGFKSEPSHFETASGESIDRDVLPSIVFSFTVSLTSVSHAALFSSKAFSVIEVISSLNHLMLSHIGKFSTQFFSTNFMNIAFGRASTGPPSLSIAFVASAYVSARLKSSNSYMIALHRAYNCSLTRFASVTFDKTSGKFPIPGPTIIFVPPTSLYPYRDVPSPKRDSHTSAHLISPSKMSVDACAACFRCLMRSMCTVAPCVTAAHASHFNSADEVKSSSSLSILMNWPARARAATVASVVANATRATAHGRVDRRRPMRDHRHRVARYVSRRASRDDRGS